MSKKSRRHSFKPEVGKIYNNHGGGIFRTVGWITSIRTHYGSVEWRAVMQNVASGWTFEARGIAIYPDGTIDWDYSVGGHFEPVTVC